MHLATDKNVGAKELLNDPLAVTLMNGTIEGLTVGNGVDNADASGRQRCGQQPCIFGFSCRFVFWFFCPRRNVRALAEII